MALVIIAAVFPPGCGTADDKTVCQPGTDGCPCIDGTDCVAGLSCVNDACAEASDVSAMIDQIASAVERDRLLRYVYDLTAIGTRYYTTAGNDEARDWIRAQLESFGYTVELQTFPARSTTGDNLIAVKQGRGKTEQYIIIGAHYDSTSESPTIRAPGASDNAAGVAVLVEAARILSSYDNEYTIKFIFFDAEEIGFVGGAHYANEAYANDDQIRFVFNIDGVGGQKDFEGQHIVCEEDQDRMSSGNNPDNTTASRALNAELIETMQLYGSVPTRVDFAHSSDYEEFEHLGYVIVGLYEEDGQGAPNYHRSTDTLEEMNPDFFYEVARGAIVFLAKQSGVTSQPRVTASIGH